jgi:hypothetical protein
VLWWIWQKMSFITCFKGNNENIDADKKEISEHGATVAAKRKLTQYQNELVSVHIASYRQRQLKISKQFLSLSKKKEERQGIDLK